MVERVTDQCPCPRDVTGVEGIDRLMQGGIGLAFAFGLSPAGAFNVRTRAVVLPIEKQDAGPQIDGVFVAVGEVFVETAEQQLLDPRIAFRAGKRLGRTQVRALRIH
jgi:hypothetical protein